MEGCDDKGSWLNIIGELRILAKHVRQRSEVSNGRSTRMGAQR